MNPNDEFKDLFKKTKQTDTQIMIKALAYVFLATGSLFLGAIQPNELFRSADIGVFDRKEQWTCPKCDYRNNDAARYCGACQYDKYGN